MADTPPQQPTPSPQQLITNLTNHLAEANELITFLRNRVAAVRGEMQARYEHELAERSAHIADLENQLRDLRPSGTTTGDAG